MPPPFILCFDGSRQIAQFQHKNLHQNLCQYATFASHSPGGEARHGGGDGGAVRQRLSLRELRRLFGLGGGGGQPTVVGEDA